MKDEKNTGRFLIYKINSASFVKGKYVLRHIIFDTRILGLYVQVGMSQKSIKNISLFSSYSSRLIHSQTSLQYCETTNVLVRSSINGKQQLKFKTTREYLNHYVQDSSFYKQTFKT